MLRVCRGRGSRSIYPVMQTALACPDNFKGTLRAADAARHMAEGLRRAGFDEVTTLPLADGGEGTLEAMIDARGGSRRSATVTGPLGDPVDGSGHSLPVGSRWSRWRAGWASCPAGRFAPCLDPGHRRAHRRGDPRWGPARDRRGGRERDDRRRSRRAGGPRVVVGRGAGDRRLRREHALPRRGQGVRTAEGSQCRPGVAPDPPSRDARRPVRAAHRGRRARSRGRRARPVASRVASPRSARSSSPASRWWPTPPASTALEGVDLVVTGEGRLDATSFEGKVVGGVLEWAGDAGVPHVAVIAGQVTADAREELALHGARRCWRSPTGCGSRARRSLAPVSWWRRPRSRPVAASMEER